MATLSQVQTTIGDGIRIAEEFAKYLNTNTERFTSGATSHEAELRSNLQTDYDNYSLMASSLEGFRRQLDAAMATAPGIVQAAVLELRQVLDIPETEPQEIMRRLYQHFVDNSLTVKSRTFTFGTPSAAGGNNGNGVLRPPSVEDPAGAWQQSPSLAARRCHRLDTPWVGCLFHR